MTYSVGKKCTSDLQTFLSPWMGWKVGKCFFFLVGYEFGRLCQGIEWGGGVTGDFFLVGDESGRLFQKTALGGVEE